MDFDPDELKRQMSVSLAVAPLEWQGHKINLIDAPGYADFYGEVAQATRIADGALILVDAVAGAQVGTDAVWKRTAHLPRLIVINKMDRENADYRSTLDSLRERYGKGVVPVVFPIGKADSLSGVVDLLEDKAYIGGASRAAGRARLGAGQLRSVARDARRERVRAGRRPDQQVPRRRGDHGRGAGRTVLRLGVREGKLFPVLATAGARVDWSRSAAVRDRALAAVAGGRWGAAREWKDLSPSDKLAALVFKTVSDANIGRLSYVRVYSGALSAD